MFYFKNRLAPTEKIGRESARLGDFWLAARLSAKFSLTAGRLPKKSDGLIKVVSNKSWFEYWMSQLPAGSDFRFSKLRTTIMWRSHRSSEEASEVGARSMAQY